MTYAYKTEPVILKLGTNKLDPGYYLNVEYNSLYGALDHSDYKLIDEIIVESRKGLTFLFKNIPLYYEPLMIENQCGESVFYAITEGDIIEVQLLRRE